MLTNKCDNGNDLLVNHSVSAGNCHLVGTRPRLISWLTRWRCLHPPAGGGTNPYRVVCFCYQMFIQQPLIHTVDMAGHSICEYCGRRFSNAKKAREHSDQRGHQVRPLKPDEYDQSAASEPFKSYTAETTAEYRQSALEATDGPTHKLTHEVAQARTRAGGRISRTFTGTVSRHSQNQTYEWTVYAPAPNPFHVAAAVVDVLVKADSVEDVQADISNRTPAAITETVRGNRMYFEFEPDEYDQLERCIRQLRWCGGVENDDVAPLEGLDRTDHADIQQLTASPGDAWDHHSVCISVREEVV